VVNSTLLRGGYLELFKLREIRRRKILRGFVRGDAKISICPNDSRMGLLRPIATFVPRKERLVIHNRFPSTRPCLRIRNRSDW
jgi:hypothetical protein